jgi:GntR family transcriptional regulator / MocR family aminotransferase
MRRLYAEKRIALLNALRETFGNAAVPWGDASGLHVALQFPGKSFDSRFIGRCEQAGIRISTVSQYCSADNGHADKLLIGYGCASAARIQEGIKALQPLILQEFGD